MYCLNPKFAFLSISESEIKNAIIKISGTDKITKSQRGLIMKMIKASGVLYDMAIVNKVISTMMERLI